MTQLIAKNIKDAKFDHPNGYYMISGQRAFGVYNPELNAWLTFDGKNPYTPAGGRKSALEVAATIEQATLQWIQQIN